MSLKSFVIEEIPGIKSFNKSSFALEVNNWLFDPNESLISSQSDEIKFLRDEIDNENLVAKALLENLRYQNFSFGSDFSDLIIHVKNQIPRMNHSSKLTELPKTIQLNTITNLIVSNWSQWRWQRWHHLCYTQ